MGGGVRAVGGAVSGDVWEGGFRNGKKHGVGTLLKSHYKNGVGEQQEYREGELVAA